MRIVGPVLVSAAFLVGWWRIRQDGSGFRAAYNRLLAAGCTVLAASIVLPAVFVADEGSLPAGVVVVLDVVRLGGLALICYAAWLARAIRAVSAPADRGEVRPGVS